MVSTHPRRRLVAFIVTVPSPAIVIIIIIEVAIITDVNLVGGEPVSTVPGRGLVTATEAVAGFIIVVVRLTLLLYLMDGLPLFVAPRRRPLAASVAAMNLVIFVLTCWRLLTSDVDSAQSGGLCCGMWFIFSMGGGFAPHE